METIGLNFNKMVDIQAWEHQRARESIEENVQASIARYIKQGYSRKEAVFKAGITAGIAANVTGILAVIDANNQRLLSNLKEIGLFNR